MTSTLLNWFGYLSRVCGFDTVDCFPPAHPYARTRWNGAYFDIASDVKPDEVERRICVAIGNTPLVFAYITNPTPRMQRALLAVLAERVRRRLASARELVKLLIDAYHSRHTPEAVPGLRAAIENSADLPVGDQVHTVLAFLTQMQAPYDVIDMED